MTGKVDEQDAGYVAAFDGLRAIAVSAVIAFHCFWLKGGWAGVDVFFVLSGFLITRNLKREFTDQGSIRLGRFYLRRILRLTPALWALLAFLALLAPFRTHPENTGHALALSVAYLMNWSRAFAWFPDDLLDHTWSLAMEEQFYLLWPILFLAVARRRPAFWLGAAFLLVIGWRVALGLQGATFERLYCGFDTHSDGLLLGCLMAVVQPLPRLRAAASRLAVIPILGLFSIFVALPIDSIVAQSIGLSVTAVLSAWLILVASGGGIVVRLLSVRPLAFLGRISYGLYLWHFPILVLLQSKVPPVLVPALVAASLLMAVLSFVVIERPFLRLKDMIEPATRAARCARVQSQIASTSI